MGLLKKIREISKQYDLIDKNDSILIALSGGPDSVVLLHLLTKIRNDFDLSLSAVYINHQIRKQDAKKEEQFCQKLCDEHDIELHLVSENIPVLSKKIKKGIEETARDFRYGVFETLSKENGYNKVALGHHLNDRVETVLFRIFRGTGISGLKGIPPKRDIYIRPLFDISKQEIIDYLNSHSLSFCQDVSNFSTDYKRNYIRNTIIPELQKNLNPAVEKAILTLTDTVMEEDEHLSTLAAKKLAVLKELTPGGKIILDRKKLDQCDKWLRRRIIRACLTELSDDKTAPDKETVDRVDKFIQQNEKAVSLPGKIQARRVRDNVILHLRKKLTFKQKLPIGEEIELSQIDLLIKMTIKKRSNTQILKKKKTFKGQFDSSKLTPPFVIRSIREGDRFQPLGLTGTKKIGDYLTDRKVNPVLRDEIPVVTDKKGIIWLVGYEIDNRAKIDHKTNEVLEIEVCLR